MFLPGWMAFVHWNVDPELVRFGSLSVRWYGLLFAGLFGLGFVIVRRIFRAENKDETSLNALTIYLFLGTIIGARLGHCFFYEPAYFLAHPWEIPAVWKGGLASHGGAAGILIALYLYSRKRPDQPYLWLLDRLVVPAALAGALIRVGNLFNSEILGTPTRLPWGFVFERVDDVPRHPVQLYEAAGYALIFVVLWRLYWKFRAATPRGLLLGLFLASVFLFRFSVEFFKERQAAYEANLPISVGQWLSIPFLLAGLFLIWRAKRRKDANAANPGRF